MELRPLVELSKRYPVGRANSIEVLCGERNTGIVEALSKERSLTTQIEQSSEWYCLTAGDVANRLETGIDTGLTAAEAETPDTPEPAIPSPFSPAEEAAPAATSPSAMAAEIVITRS